MRASVIISTYNSPDWLQKVLWSYECQSIADFEVLIADDGSSQDNVKRIEAMMAASPLAIRHLWQEDEGFQKWRIVNRALKEATSDYIIITDGDCIAVNNLVELHLGNRKPGTYLSGGYSKLPMQLSQKISQDDILSGQCFDVSWLMKNGMKPSSNILKVGSRKIGADGLLNRITTAKRTFNGNNSSLYREDALKVNGFDERIKYGGGDREFGYRLAHAGVKPVGFRYSAPCLHLDHARGYKDPEIRKANDKIISNTCTNKVTWTHHGITP